MKRKILKEKPPTQVYHREHIFCHLCNKTYMDKYSLAKHMKLHHTKNDTADTPANAVRKQTTNVQHLNSQTIKRECWKF